MNAKLTAISITRFLTILVSLAHSAFAVEEAWGPPTSGRFTERRYETKSDC
jgi:hypothetical protein